MFMCKTGHTELLASPERAEGKCGFIRRLRQAQTDIKIY